MSRFLFALPLVFVALCQPAFAVVDTFNFSYISQSMNVTGTFTGVESSGTVGSIVVGSVEIGATSLSTPIQNWDFFYTSQGGAQASYSLSGNSFLFLSGSTYFQIGTNVSVFVNANNGTSSVTDSNPNSLGTWVLINQGPAGVPDSGPTALLLSGAFMGLVAFRRARIVV